MSSWRDDLPPIPSERIIDDAVREGRRRQDRRREQRRRAFTFGGVGLAAAAVVGLVTASLVRGPSDDDDAASEATVAPAGTEPAGTEAPAGTDAAEATTAETEAEATETTAATGDTVVPVSDEVVVAPSEVWETAAGEPACGPTDVVVTYTPLESTVTAATVRWSTAGAFGESPMTVADGVATATIGPFPPDTLVDIDAAELQLAVLAVDASGATRQLRSPTDVVLRDCSG